MCYTSYRFVVCNRCIEQEREHTFIVHRHPEKKNDDEKCPCFEVHHVLDRHLPCPMCLDTILFRMKLEADLQRQAGPDVDIETDYRQYPVFYADDEVIPPASSTRHVTLVAIRKRERRSAFIGGLEN
ncbi:hypothetical protein ABW21_db0204751 [Orbilia brochopaga]|nr:hypothetical protein ABW21_db0204751 [Drechslerella brochopaga]